MLNWSQFPRKWQTAFFPRKIWTHWRGKYKTLIDAGYLTLQSKRGLTCYGLTALPISASQIQQGLQQFQRMHFLLNDAKNHVVNCHRISWFLKGNQPVICEIDGPNLCQFCRVSLLRPVLAAYKHDQVSTKARLIFCSFRKYGNLIKFIDNSNARGSHNQLNISQADTFQVYDQTH